MRMRVKRVIELRVATEPANHLFLLIQVEETKLNNRNANDHETRHAGIFS